MKRIPESRGAAAPAQFDPDPGAWVAVQAGSEPSLFSTYQFPDLAAPAPERADEYVARGPLERAQIVPVPSPAYASTYGLEPLPPALKLPRAGVREDVYVSKRWTAPDRYDAGAPLGRLPRRPARAGPLACGL